MALLDDGYGASFEGPRLAEVEVGVLPAIVGDGAVARLVAEQVLPNGALLGVVRLLGRRLRQRRDGEAEVTRLKVVGPGR
eukprot:6206853-Pleurochrysis_carterae.AAC.1